MYLAKKILTVIIITLICACGEKEIPEKAKKNPESKIENTTVAKDSSETDVARQSSPGEVENTPSELEEEKKEDKPAVTSPVETTPVKVKSISKLWAVYKDAKKEAGKAIENGDIDKTVEQLKIAGESALELGRDDIAAWQFNNIGHYSIEEFKKRTSYDDRIRAMATMPSGKEKSDYISETKDLLSRQMDLLNLAQKNLERAQIIDDELEKSRRSEVIERNLDFIKWVKNFVE